MKKLPSGNGPSSLGDKDDIITGILLGDGSMATRSQGKTYSMSFAQGKKHEQYVHHLYNVFKEYIPGGCKQYKNACYWKTRTTTEFKELGFP